MCRTTVTSQGLKTYPPTHLEAMLKESSMLHPFLWRAIRVSAQLPKAPMVAFRVLKYVLLINLIVFISAFVILVAK